LDRDEALTIGRALSGLTAHAKGVRLGIFEPSPEHVGQHRQSLKPGDTTEIRLMGRNVEAIHMIQASPTDIIIGVDTHKHTHAAAAITGLGARVAELTIKVGRHGYRQLETWAAALGTVHAFGIEGTGSYGAGLARALRDGGYTVHEVSRPDRRLRRQHGKTDHVDAEGAARAVLGGQACPRRPPAGSR
jgi:hypothetical protein